MRIINRELIEDWTSDWYSESGINQFETYCIFVKIQNKDYPSVFDHVTFANYSEKLELALYRFKMSPMSLSKTIVGIYYICG